MPTALLEKQDMPKTYQEAKEAGLPVFKFFTDGPAKAAAVSGSGGDDGSPKILLTASTNVIDLAGDKISPEGMAQMRDAAVGTTIFLNHSFDVPVDVFGVVVSAELVERLDEKTSVKYLCLDYVVEVEMSNPAAAKTYEIIKNGKVKLGASITVLILDAVRLKDGTQSIVSVYYLETSIVGLPMNQSSWVRQAVKALKWLERNQPAPVAIEANPASNSKGKQQQLPVKVEKGIQKMKQVEIVHKNAFDDVMANTASWSCYDLSYILCDEISRLFIQAESGELSNPRGNLDSILNDFSSAIKMLVYPALDALSSQGEGGDVIEKSIEVGSDSDDADIDESAEDDETNEKSASIEAAKTFFTWKPKEEGNSSSASTRKGAAQLVKKDGAGWQEVHDFCHSQGAACSGTGSEDSDSNMSSASFDPKKIKNPVVKDFVLGLQKENKELADAAEAATRLLEQVLKQPLA